MITGNLLTETLSTETVEKAVEIADKSPGSDRKIGAFLQIAHAFGIFGNH